MKISLCLGSFYMWQEVWNIDAKLNYLELVKDFDLDGIELHFSEQELLNEDFKKFQGKLDKYFVTFHMPAFTKPKEVFDKVRLMIPLLNIQQVVIHADEWSKLEETPDDIPFVIENCDKDKSGFQNMKDVTEFNKNICFDINHVEECFPGKVCEQIAATKNLIKEVHVSCLKNPIYDELKDITTRHHLVTGSDYNIPDCVPKDVVWVIEGVVPKDRLDLLEKEIALLRNL